MAGSALLIIDMQEDFFLKPPLAELREALVGTIRMLVAEARKLRVPVIWVYQEFSPDLGDAFLEMRRTGRKITIKGTWGAGLLHELPLEREDLRLVKKRYSAFFATSLEQVLRDAGVDTVVMAGVNTHACVRMTAIDAYQRDLDVILVRDGVASYDPAHHRLSLAYMDKRIAKVMDAKEAVLVFREPTRP